MNSAETIQAEVICKEVVINAPASKVWKALTDKEHLRNWFMACEDFAPHVGNTFHFQGNKGEEICYHTSNIVEIVPEKKLSFTWNRNGIPDETLVTYELTQTNDSTTKLVLTHSNWGAMLDENPVLRTEHTSGWEYFINRIKNYSETL